MNDKRKKVIVYGGNGFVGTHSAEQLTLAGADVVCLSRSGHKPIHLKDQAWTDHVRWCKGDASDADVELLATADAMVCSVGSPPIPTLSQKAFDQQLFMNGTCCINAIESAKQAGVKRVVLMGAQVPFPLRTERFAYYKGKQQALAAAENFANASEQHGAVVLQPGMITGRRPLANGRSIRLDWLTAPVSPLMPWQFVNVERVAKRVAEAALQDQPYTGHCTVIRNRDI